MLVYFIICLHLVFRRAMKRKETNAEATDPSSISSVQNTRNISVCEAKTFWQNQRKTGQVDVLFKEVQSKLQLLWQKIKDESATKQDYVRALLLVNAAKLEDCETYQCGSAENLLEDEDCQPVRTEEPLSAPNSEVEETVTHSEPESSDAPLPLVTKHVLYKQHSCGQMCLSNVNPYFSERENPLKFPLLCHFQRQHAKSSLISRQLDVIYQTPCGKSLRGFDDVRSYLSQTKCFFLSLDHFSFNTYLQLDRNLAKNQVVFQEADISRDTELVPVSICNEIDNTRPAPFTYRKSPWPRGYSINNFTDLFIGCCDCTDGCWDVTKCACLQLTAREFDQDFTLPYKGKAPGYRHKRLQTPVPTGLYECNVSCKCDRKMCENRLVQLGLQLRLQVFKTKGKGWGVRCLDDLDKGTFVCIYAGKILMKTINVAIAQDSVMHTCAEKTTSNTKRCSHSDSEVMASPSSSGNSQTFRITPLLRGSSQSKLKRKSVCHTKQGKLDFVSMKRPNTKTSILQKRKRQLMEEGAVTMQHSSEDEIFTPPASPKMQRPVDSEDENATVKVTPKMKSNSVLADEAGYISDDNSSSVQSGGKETSDSAEFHTEENIYVLDASAEGNIGRFVNHSCLPNLFVQQVFVETHCRKIPWVAFFTKSFIKAGTELTWDYNYDVGSIPEKEIACLCGHKLCKNVIKLENRKWKQHPRDVPCPGPLPAREKTLRRCTQDCSAMASTGICALCNMSDTDHITGKLQKMPDRDIVAHYNCMLYSPGVISIDSQEDIEGFDFQISTVLKEIKRGKKLRCSHCKKNGATVGCDVQSCKKTYHFPCLIKANGYPSQDKFVVYCELHKATDNEDSDGKTKKDMLTSRKEKWLQSMDGKIRYDNVQMQWCPLTSGAKSPTHLCCHGPAGPAPASTAYGKEGLSGTRKNTVKNQQNNGGSPIHDVFNDELPGSCVQTGSRKSSSKSKHLTCRVCETPLPNAYRYSTCPSCRPHSPPDQPSQDVITPEKDFLQSSFKEVTDSVAKKRSRNQFPLSTSSEESDSILSPKVTKTFSLSGFPKRKKERSSQTKPNEKLEEFLKNISSQERNDLSQIYSELGGSMQDPAMEIASPQENQNNTVTTKDPATTNVTDTSTSSNNDEDKTPERLPDINVHANSPRSPEEHFTEEHPVSSHDEAIPDKTSTSKTDNKNSGISQIRHKLSPKSSDNKIKDSLCINTPDASACKDIPKAQSPGCLNGAFRPEVNPVATAQQIHSTSFEDMVSSQPTSCTDTGKSVRPDTSVGYTLDLFSEQQSNNLEAQGTSETHRSGCPPVTKRSVSPPPTLEKDGNKTQVSPSNGWSPAQHLNRESPRLASPSNVTTWQNTGKGQNKGDISTVVSPNQIKAISREITTGNLAKQLKSIVPQIQSTIGSQKRNMTKDAEQRRHGHSISEGSPNSSTNNKPETTNPANYLPKPLKNQEISGEPIEKDNLMCQKSSESNTLKRKLTQDFEELLPHKKRYQPEENLSEQLEISEEQNKNNFGELATSESVESECASEHLSGPSSMTTPFKRQFGSHRRSKKRSGYQHGRFKDLDDIDGFGHAVAGQCRKLPHDRQARYMSYVFASAEFFRKCPNLPELTVLITSLQIALETSQTSTIYNPSGSSV
ncbi:histone-lysine N-methyltransferase SETDB2 [Hyla sarda]|uniref:histone-lysine N-methyltransferase SETDB2 n=1 Tax=Hyla sarda TaxID=327740 RepID=UPI0024C2F621|nr:histone-lysine N-methyltransferase SETDB2 [Hyla sarda]